MFDPEKGGKRRGYWALRSHSDGGGGSVGFEKFHTEIGADEFMDTKNLGNEIAQPGDPLYLWRDAYSAR